MRRIVCFLAGVLLVVPSLGSDALKEYDGATEKDELQGTWRMVKAETNGEPVVAMAVGAVFTFRTGKMLAVNHRLSVEDTYITRTDLRPAHLDVIYKDSKGRYEKSMHIYQINGDTLRLAFADGGFRRPKDFDEKDITIFTLKRVK
jgi:uncharacterized protein (TIGR03067 family)